MIQKSDKIAIVGAGALGGHVGAYLTREGHDVTLIDAWPEHVEHMRAHGLTLDGTTEPECFTQAVNAIHITDLQKTAHGRPFNFVFVAVKSYDTVWATHMIKNYLTLDGFCVSLQNGINEERMASVVGWGKTVGCIASTIAVELDGPGHINRNVKLGGAERVIFSVGEVHGRVTPRAEKLSEMLACVDSSEVTTNLWGKRWSKLMVNCMRNPVSAATGRGGNANDRDDHTRRLAVRLAGEAGRIGVALGYKLGLVYKIEPELLMAAEQGDGDAMAQCEEKLLANMTFRNDDQRPSMGQDMQKGRRTEIDYLNGLVVEKAKELGLPVPANEGIAEVVRQIERGKIRAGPDAIAHL
jgi:2-dehydropantoate 2-reductase